MGELLARYQTSAASIDERQNEVSGFDAAASKSSRKSFNSTRMSKRVSIAERAAMAAGGAAAPAVLTEALAGEEPKKNSWKQAIALIKAAKLTAKAASLREEADGEDGKSYETLSTMLVEQLTSKKKAHSGRLERAPLPCPLCASSLPLRVSPRPRPPSSPDTILARGDRRPQGIDELIRDWDRNNDGSIDFKVTAYPNPSPNPNGGSTGFKVKFQAQFALKGGTCD